MKPNPKFKKGDRCVFVYPVGKGKNKKWEVLDDNMIINSEPFWYERDWYYNIVGKANPCNDAYLILYTDLKNDILNCLEKR
jgi:hypothetical protein